MIEHVIAAEGQIGDGEHLIVELEGREIGLFKVDGEYHAYTNWCVHQSGPVCEGTVTGTKAARFDRASLEVRSEMVREGEILCCPWHGWQYDLETGECLSRPNLRLHSYEVKVKDGSVVVEL